MKAILIDEKKNLIWSDVPDPIISCDEVLVKVQYAALNRADLMQRAGDYPPPEGAPEWMGLEISGEIIELGENAGKNSSWNIGDKVCVLLGGGGYAEYVSVRYDMLMPIPKGISMAEAAALPEAFATAYLNLFIEGEGKSGETLLMHAGASGLASVVIPMAKSFGMRVITSVLSDEKANSIKHLGADVIINSGTQKVSDILKAELESGHPVNLAIDCLGGEMLGECIPYAALKARWIVIATLAGDSSNIPLKTLFKRGIRIIGSTLRSRTPDVKAQILSSLVANIWPKVSEGEIRPTIYKILPITQAQQAHAILEHGENVGKVVLCL